MLKATLKNVVAGKCYGGTACQDAPKLLHVRSKLMWGASYACKRHATEMAKVGPSPTSNSTRWLPTCSLSSALWAGETMPSSAKINPVGLTSELWKACEYAGATERGSVHPVALPSPLLSAACGRGARSALV